MNIRIVSVLLFLLYHSIGTNAQYTVTKVVGAVKNATRNELLKTGSRISEKDKLLFSSPSDQVRIIIPGKGTSVLLANPKAIREENTVLEILKSSFHLKAKEGYLSGRAGNFESLPEAFETEIGFNQKNLISPQNKYPFNKEQFSVDDGSQFFLQVSLEGQSSVIRTLKTTGDTLLINAFDFKVPNADMKKAHFELGYYSKVKNSSQSLAAIQPYIDTTNEMQSIIKVVMQLYLQKEKSEIEKECYKEVYEALGKPSDLTFLKIFNYVYTKRKVK